MGVVERFLKCSYHLGDTAGAFPNSPYIGLTLRLPIYLPPPSDFEGDLILKIAAEELFGNGYYSHPVLLIDKRVGALGVKDPDIDEKGRFQFHVDRDYVIEIFERELNPTVSIVNQHVGGNLDDDFVVTGYGVSYNKP